MAEVTKEEAQATAMQKIEGLFGGEKPADPVVVPAEGEQQVAEAQAEGEGEVPASQEQPEEVEVEIDGETYLIPKKISDRFIHHADYTRKTQDVAEMRRALSAEREAHVLEQAFQNATVDDKQQIALLDAQIGQFKKLDWGALETETLLKARAQFDQLKDARAELDTSIKAKRAEFDQKIKSVSQEAIQAGQKYIEQHIKGFNDSLKQELFAYGLNESYTRDEMDRIVDPRIVVTLWKAKQWDTLQASKPGIMKKAAQAAPVIRPGGTKQQPSRVQVLAKKIGEAKTRTGKKLAMEDYFAAKFGG